MVQKKPSKPPNYFEAIIQLRNPSQELINFVVNQIEKREDTFIAKTERQKNGIDLYISSQRFARALGKRMKKSFKGELKTTRSLFSRNNQTSRNVYRVTVLFRVTG